jgi:hypothetical protein
MYRIVLVVGLFPSCSAPWAEAEPLEGHSIRLAESSSREALAGERVGEPGWIGWRTYLGRPRAIVDCDNGRGWDDLWHEGNESVDVLGQGLVYHWRVVSAPETPKPSVTMGGGTNSLFRIHEPFGGPWEIGLRVEDAGGRLSLETTCRVLRRHPARLAVELSWEHGLDAADLDLHLVQGWADLWDIPGDCHFANINDPGWDGTSTTRGDGCQLQVDSRGAPGEAGPGELVYCHNPREGVIDVVVDEFDGGSPEADEEPVLVRIWLDNRLIYDTLEQRPSTEWWVARVDLKTNTAIRLDPPVESEE